LRQPPYQVHYLQEKRKRTNKLKHFRNRILRDTGNKKFQLATEIKERELTFCTDNKYDKTMTASNLKLTVI